MDYADWLRRRATNRQAYDTQRAYLFNHGHVAACVVLSSTVLDNRQAIAWQPHQAVHLWEHLRKCQVGAADASLCHVLRLFVVEHPLLPKTPVVHTNSCFVTHHPSFFRIFWYVFTKKTSSQWKRLPSSRIRLSFFSLI